MAQVCVAGCRLREDDATELLVGTRAAGGRQHQAEQGATE